MARLRSQKSAPKPGSSLTIRLWKIVQQVGMFIVEAAVDHLQDRSSEIPDPLEPAGGMALGAM
jgi:hypothetical protein